MESITSPPPWQHPCLPFVFCFVFLRKNAAKTYFFLYKMNWKAKVYGSCAYSIVKRANLSSTFRQRSPFAASTVSLFWMSFPFPLSFFFGPLASVLPMYAQDERSENVRRDESLPPYIRPTRCKILPWQAESRNQKRANSLATHQANGRCRRGRRRRRHPHQ